ncbi:hypothetical protein M407DRAFT_31697 [Tulasnella calospora MUT 4182]|uniref:CBM1 domain-containing protein n=1 Tax=Tulasnella calospora MUT 4182 TaxID=1051891 RepID=A0A0C3LAX4_9AGAM|nr:hypothetical protein M407DRAFT_31697 [Tulasnella calospora MUT 4182]
MHKITFITAIIASFGAVSHAGAPLWAQCGGIGFTGPTVCDEGFCTRLNDCNPTLTSAMSTTSTSAASTASTTSTTITRSTTSTRSTRSTTPHRTVSAVKTTTTISASATRYTNLPTHH